MSQSTDSTTTYRHTTASTPASRRHGGHEGPRTTAGFATVVALSVAAVAAAMAPVAVAGAAIAVSLAAATVLAGRRLAARTPDPPDEPRPRRDSAPVAAD